MGKSTQNLNSEDDLELDLELKKIIKDIQKHPYKSREYRGALNQLLLTIEKSGKLSYPQKNTGIWANQYYEYLRQQAISKTFEAISKNIEKYNPNYQVMQWVNGILKNRFIDVMRAEKRFLIDSIDDPKQPPIVKSEPEVNVLEQTEARQKCIENNPIFYEKHIKNRSVATFGKLVIMKYFQGKTFQDMASEFAIDSHSTISGFLYREIKKDKINKALRKCLQEDE